MFGTEHLLLFVVSGLLLNITPGQDTLYIVGRSVSQGRRAGLLSVLGISSGSAVHTVAAAFGLSAILAASSQAFFALKLAGAAYLAYLGLRMILERAPATDDIAPATANIAPATADIAPATADIAPATANIALATANIALATANRVTFARESGWAIFRAGFFTNLLNPKVALFFMAFLPQFVASSAESRVLAFLFLGTIFIVNGTLWCLVLVWGASAVSARLRRHAARGALVKRATGAVFVGLGVRLAVSK
jgi:threonine/homoserine/homoserine lactone efflux protein